MGGAGWTRAEARVADDSDFETLKNLLGTGDGWNLEYEKDGVKVWAENAAHGALRTVKVCFVAQMYSEPSTHNPRICRLKD
ncbi:jg5299 [Pararge aegeria aegeria]|uniref:Jg5299 protein n=1 Tax=Pararge aegeria aegeria TaxID=348720 RepID=A0A8S4RCU8_9NEOP|nr:jg5299 [Pararge aegeria aegeria]